MKLETLLQRKERYKQEQKNIDSQIRETLKKEATKKKREINSFLDHLGMYDLIIDDKTIKPVFLGVIQETIELLEEPVKNAQRIEQLKEIGIFKEEELKEYKLLEAKKRKERDKQAKSEIKE